MSEYRPFDALADWNAGLIDEHRWSGLLDHVAELQTSPSDFGWLDGPLRAAAYQSGAIEGLHPGDRGLTMTLIEATTEWQAAVASAPDGGGTRVVEFIEAGVDALQMALDLATNAQPISESWIRQIHAVACRPQDTYRVNTAAGSQDHALPHGEYKHHDNHVHQADGSMLWFCPAAEVPHEMARFVAELQSEVFAAEHPVVQAAFAHQAVTHIHPFADGNGRVARVLASIFLLRSASLPFFLFADRKPRYIAALAHADAGHQREFVREVLAAVEDLAALLVQRSRAAKSNFDRTRQRFDEAAAFARAVEDGVERARVRHRIRPDVIETDDPVAKLIAEVSPPASVQPGDLPQLRRLTIPVELSLGPVSSIEILDLRLDLIADVTHPSAVRARASGLELRARGDEVWPTVGQGFELRLDSWLDEVIGALAAALSAQLGS